MGNDPKEAAAMPTERGFRGVSAAEEDWIDISNSPNPYSAARGRNVQTSPFLDEIRAEAIQVMLMYQGRHKYGRAPTKKQQKALEAIKDSAQLRDLAVWLLDVNSWTELLEERQ